MIRILIKRDSHEEVTIAIVTAESNTKITDSKSLLSAVTAAVTTWLANSEAGQSIDRLTRNDFNIGDLSEHLDDEQLQIALATHWVRGLEIEIFSYEDFDRYWSFDTILFDPILFDQD